jgi:hypothetical protein
MISKVIHKHPYFSYDEVKEICEMFLDEQDPKIKQETKLKRLSKYLQSEFELDLEVEIEKDSQKIYSLETIPKYLFT